MSNTSRLASGGALLKQLCYKWQQKYPGLCQLQFSDWALWDNRRIIRDLNEVGVYILAKFDDVNNMPKIADFLDYEVIYIGKTNIGETTSLFKRLNQFNSSAFKGASGHAGGMNYNDIFGNNKEGLLVSACPVYVANQAKFVDYYNSSISDGLQEYVISRIVTLLEVCLRGLYVFKWGKLPRCNKE